MAKMCESTENRIKIVFIKRLGNPLVAMVKYNLDQAQKLISIFGLAKLQCTTQNS